jgi:hypothetical protein
LKNLNLWLNIADRKVASKIKFKKVLKKKVSHKKVSIKEK